MSAFKQLEGTSFTKFSETNLLFGTQLGSIGVLALDLLIFNNNCKKIGYFQSKCVSPSVGNNTEISKDQNDCLTLPCEIFQTKNTTILQIRSGIIPGKVGEFIKELHKFFEEYQFKSIIVFTASNFSGAPDFEIKSTIRNVYCIQNEKFKKVNENSSILNDAVFSKTELLIKDLVDETEVDVLAGLAKKIITKKKFQQFPISSILIFGISSIENYICGLLSALNFTLSYSFPDFEKMKIEQLGSNLNECKSNYKIPESWELI